MIKEFQSFHLSVLLIAGILFLVAAISDVRAYRIPNSVSFALVLLFPVYVLCAPTEVSWQQHMMVFVLVLVIGLMMFSGNLAGAGDIKLLSAAALWSGANLIGVLIVTTGLAGGLLALCIGIVRILRHKASGGMSLSGLAKVPIPYGVAIAIGGMTCLVMLAFPNLW